MPGGEDNGIYLLQPSAGTDQLTSMIVSMLRWTFQIYDNTIKYRKQDNIVSVLIRCTFVSTQQRKVVEINISGKHI